MQTERRTSPRHTVLKRARIELTGGHCSLGCVLLDMSKDGAKLRTDEWLPLPDEFELRLDDGNRRKARVCYRNLEVSGIRFTDITGKTAA